MKITSDSTLQLHPLEIRKDNKNYIVEDLVAQEFYEMQVVGTDAIEMIMNGYSLGEVERHLVKKYPQEDIDIIDFAQQLIEIELVKSINQEEIYRKLPNKKKFGFEWITPSFAKIFFNRYTSILYIVLLISNILIFIFHPNLIPHYQDLFVFKSMSLNVLSYGLLSVFFIIIHEFGHIFAIRSVNLPTKLEIGHRLFFIVGETDLTLAWKLPPKKRTMLFLAGLCFDVGVLFLILCTKLFISLPSPILSGLIDIIIFDIFVRFIYQCCVYMKTDFYYMFENLTGSYNIMENSLQYLKQKFSRERNRKVNEMFNGEEYYIKWYSLFYLLGVCLTLGLFTFYFIPQLVYMIVNIIPGFAQPISDPLFWDATLFSLQICIIIGFLSYSMRKKYSSKSKI